MVPGAVGHNDHEDHAASYGVPLLGKNRDTSGNRCLIASLWHWLAQQFIRMAKDTLDPRLAFSLVMEPAIMMSKVDPKSIPQTRPSDG